MAATACMSIAIHEFSPRGKMGAALSMFLAGEMEFICFLSLTVRSQNSWCRVRCSAQRKLCAVVPGTTQLQPLQVTAEHDCSVGHAIPFVSLFFSSPHICLVNNTWNVCSSYKICFCAPDIPHKALGDLASPELICEHQFKNPGSNARVQAQPLLMCLQETGVGEEGLP